jgi:UTP--glucose-1-phosphate uridylyltransferase
MNKASEPKKVTKAVIAAAGFGTRLLPQTKAMPKEMLPLVDKPIIQYIVEDLAAAGIKEIIIVTGYHKRTIEDHFDALNADLANNLRQGNKLELLEEIEAIPNLANFAYVRQKGPYGSATPLMNVAHLVGDEPFIYTYADDLILAKPNRFSQMIELYEEFGGSIIPCITVDKDEEFQRYGIVAGEEVRSGVLKMSEFVEKPGRENAPSNFASVGGYLLTPDIFPYLESAREKLPEGQEFFLTTYGLATMMKDGKPLFACKLTDSEYFDTGNKLDYLKTVVNFGMRHPDLGPALRDYLKTL